MSNKLTSGERSQCHARPRGSDGHEPSRIDLALQGTCRHCSRPITNVLGVWMLKQGEPILAPEPKSQYALIDLAGRVTNCDRCGAPCRVADRRNPESHPFKLSEKPKGVCANCVMTQFLYNTYPINLQIDEAGPELLLKPGIREAFLSCGLLDGCDLNIDEVNWAQVVANWALPVQHRKSPTNPYKMGDSPKSYLHRGKAQPKRDEFTDKWDKILDANRGGLRGDLATQFVDESGAREALDEARSNQPQVEGDKWVN